MKIDWNGGSSVADGCAFRYKQSFLREQQITICDESVATGAPTPETTGSGRARGKRTRNGNQFSLRQKKNHFSQ